MAGLGTIINTAGIIIGGLIGLLFGKVMNKRLQDIFMSSCGVCVMFIGIAGAIEQMMTVSGGKLTSGKSMAIIISIVLGALVGGLIDIERRIEQFGAWLRHISKSDSDAKFIDGFVSASLTVCVGAMAVLGAINDGIYKDCSLLVTKTVLDMIIIMIMTAAMGKGCIFSAVPVAVFQGAVTALASLIAPVMTDAALANLSLVGAILIFCVGVNLIWSKKIPVANMLPAIIFAVILAYTPI